MNLFYQPDIPNGTHHLDADESRHAVKVLRMQSGNPIELTDGLGNLYKAVIKKTDPHTCSFTITDTRHIAARSFSMAIAMAPTKNIDRTEWFVEKAIEMGIEAIHFMRCKNSERKTINLDRIQKIAVSAMKQSGQARLPFISDMRPMEEVCSMAASQKFICFVDHANPETLKTRATEKTNYLVLIGPEGDFRPDELEMALHHGFAKVSLGPTRLRTETAALVACHTLNLINL